MKVCPKCGREFGNSSVRCVICKCDLKETGEKKEPVRKSGVGMAAGRGASAGSVTRRTMPQTNYQRMQQTKKEQERQKLLEQEAARRQALLEQERAREEQEKRERKMQMRVWKLVSGILSIVLSFVVLSQSRTLFVLGAFVGDDGTSALAGILVGIMMLVGGIVSIVCRKAGKGGNIAIGILYGIGAFIGIMLAGVFGDLKVYSFWCFVCMILAIISASKASKAGNITAIVFGCVWVLFLLISGGENDSSANRDSQFMTHSDGSGNTQSGSYANDSYKREESGIDSMQSDYSFSNEDEGNLSDQIIVAEQYSYENSIGSTYFVLVVRNNSDKTVSIRANTVAKDGNGNIVGAADGSEEPVGAGQEVCLLHGFFDISDIADFEYTLYASECRYSDSAVQDLSYTQNMTENGAVFQVTNNGREPVEFVEGRALFFSGGRLVYSDSTYFTDDDSELKSGNTISKQLEPYVDFDSVQFYLTGRRQTW